MTLPKKPVPLSPELDPSGLREHALLIYDVKNGSLHCEMRSSTEERFYKIAVRLSDGACACQCKWFEHRCKWAQPTIYSGTVCRHIKTYREYLQKEVAIERGDITRDEAKEESETFEGRELHELVEAVFRE